MLLRLRYHYHMPLILLLVPIVSTLVGGALALRFRTHLTLLIGFGCGLLLGAALLDLLPQALGLGAGAGISRGTVLALTVAASVLFAVLGAGLEWMERRWQRQGHTGGMFHRAGALMLVFHSFPRWHGDRRGVLGLARGGLCGGVRDRRARPGRRHEHGAAGRRAARRRPRWTTRFWRRMRWRRWRAGLSTAWWVLSARGSVWVLVDGDWILSGGGCSGPAAGASARECGAQVDAAGAGGGRACDLGGELAAGGRASRLTRLARTARQSPPQCKRS